ncbi:uncharacterized protein C2orf81 homolog isoform X2 [Xiphophorus couchianus]|uniref:uncharacterized protein C2orf81 homolog isoform X1 n=1 Tax=Xiphophorus couchianus TaxID=32473 RepID=UPI00101679D0|nr:uncharacterized protein C2orf81 homolog isoform X1 [Xiphophorus couchianus]XP_027890883.1 uncharacterized protein C2orf81 homolog isoform X2 [Xiphophorus couchianus]
MKRPSQNRKKDKQKGKSNVKEVPVPEQEEEVVNPTQVNRPLWTDMLSPADEIVGDIMDELEGQVIDGCYKSFIGKQLVPYSVSWVKNYLTKTVECQLLCLDSGEEPEELASTEDLEPMPAIPDCWAQGCVPTIHIDVGCDQESSHTESGVRRRSKLSSLKNGALKPDEIEEKHKKDDSDLSSNVSSTCPPASSDRKKILQVKKPPLFGSSEKKNVEVEVEVEDEDKDSVASKTTLAHRRKDLHPIPKLDPKQLPRHCISPEYEIVDNDFSKRSPRKSCVLPRLEPKLTKQKSNRAETSSKTISKEPPERFQKKNDDKIHLPKQDKERYKLFGPLRLDTMILAKGVSLLDSQAAQSIPPKMSYPSQATNLKPISSDVAVPIYSVDQVAAASTPRVTPIMQTKNGDSGLKELT